MEEKSDYGEQKSLEDELPKNDENTDVKCPPAAQVEKKMEASIKQSPNTEEDVTPAEYSISAERDVSSNVVNPSSLNQCDESGDSTSRHSVSEPEAHMPVVDSSTNVKAGVPSQSSSTSSFEISRGLAARVYDNEPKTEKGARKRDWISDSKFHCVLEPSVSHADIYTKVNRYHSSSIDCEFFDKDQCHYTVPVEGTYKFMVVKHGDVFKFRLYRDDGKYSLVQPKKNRGSAKIDVTWPCCAGQKVWVEDIEDQNDVKIIINGHLLED